MSASIYCHNDSCTRNILAQCQLVVMSQLATLFVILYTSIQWKKWIKTNSNWIWFASPFCVVGGRFFLLNPGPRVFRSVFWTEKAAVARGESKRDSFSPLRVHDSKSIEKEFNPVPTTLHFHPQGQSISRQGLGRKLAQDPLTEGHVTRGNFPCNLQRNDDDWKTLQVVGWTRFLKFIFLVYHPSCLLLDLPVLTRPSPLSPSWKRRWPWGRSCKPLVAWRWEYCCKAM